MEALDVLRDRLGRPYFHEVVPGGFDQLKLEHPRWTIGDVIARLAQPEWCGYPEAVGGIMGCWSLIGGYVKCESYCHNCDEHRQNQVNPPRYDTETQRWNREHYAT